MVLAVVRACVLGCPEDARTCKAHPARPRRQELDERRGSASERGYGSRWRKFRDAYLARHPLCVACQRCGRVSPAVVVDHVKPHGGDMRIFWALPDNAQGLCSACDGAKKPRESGIAPCPGHGVATAEVMGERVCRDCGRAA